MLFAVAWDALQLQDRCLVYTAVSRARYGLVVVGGGGARTGAGRREGDPQVSAAGVDGVSDV